MKSTTRALRRHHRERLMEKRKHYWGYPRIWGYPPYQLAEMSPAQLSKVARTPHPCSRFCCGNVRPLEGAPFRELRDASNFECTE
jgi:hypothetical protein